MIEEAISQLKRGKPILLYDFDGRESEVDMIIPASAISSEYITLLRRDAGGMICYVIDGKIGKLLSLPFLGELLNNSGFAHLRAMASKRMRYGDFPAFSIWVNYAGVRTGISDEDRALTIRELHKVAELAEMRENGDACNYLKDNFIAPGHVPILIARKLSERHGHTEISVQLFKAAGLTPSLVLCEMLDAGKSLSLDKARDYAKRHGLPLIEGKEVLERCSRLE